MSMINALEGGDFSDITLVLPDGRKLQAHKVILTSRSGYFRGMLGSSFLESGATSIELKDFETDILHTMIDCIYRRGSLSGHTGKTINESADTLKALLKAAQYYQVDVLIESVICNVTTTLKNDVWDKAACDTAIGILHASDRVQFEPYAEILIEAFCKHLLRLFRLDSFWSLLDEYAYLSSRVLALLWQKNVNINAWCGTCDKAALDEGYESSVPSCDVTGACCWCGQDVQ